MLEWSLTTTKMFVNVWKVFERSLVSVKMVSGWSLDVISRVFGHCMGGVLIVSKENREGLERK